MLSVWGPISALGEDCALLGLVSHVKAYLPFPQFALPSLLSFSSPRQSLQWGDLWATHPHPSRPSSIVLLSTPRPRCLCPKCSLFPQLLASVPQLRSSHPVSALWEERASQDDFVSDQAVRGSADPGAAW